jgi:hypothetical protein
MYEFRQQFRDMTFFLFGVAFMVLLWWAFQSQ